MTASGMTVSGTALPGTLGGTGRAGICTAAGGNVSVEDCKPAACASAADDSGRASSNTEHDRDRRRI
jgi:hypothetical protein